jgi:hypothetical protein
MITHNFKKAQETDAPVRGRPLTPERHEVRDNDVVIGQDARQLSIPRFKRSARLLEIVVLDVVAGRNGVLRVIQGSPDNFLGKSGAANRVLRVRRRSFHS